jgi:hypothetical protein
MLELQDQKYHGHEKGDRNESILEVHFGNKHQPMTTNAMPTAFSTAT